MQDKEKNASKIPELYTAIFVSQLWSSDYQTNGDCKRIVDPTGQVKKVVIFQINLLSKKSNVTHTIAYN